LLPRLLPDQCSEADLEQARRELAGTTIGEEDGRTEFRSKEGLASISTGSMAPSQTTTDEQQTTQEVVEEGLQEATHEQMVQGNQESRKRDAAQTSSGL
jgi:hypothetical protein